MNYLRRDCCLPKVFLFITGHYIPAKAGAVHLGRGQGDGTPLLLRNSAIQFIQSQFSPA